MDTDIQFLQHQPLLLHRIVSMDENKIKWDDEAERLFSQFEGMEDQRKGRSVAQMMTDSLIEEQKQQDIWRILLCDIAHRIAGYLKPAGHADPSPGQDPAFTELTETLTKLSRFPQHAGRILIRYRGFSSNGEIPEKQDYEILFGNMVVDLESVPAMIKRNGRVLAHLLDRLLDAFGTFSENGINNLHLTLPLGDAASFDQLKKALGIFSGFYRDHGLSGESVQTPNGGGIALDENGAADPNLTLVAGINRLSATTMKTLVAKVDAWMREKEAAEAGCRFTSVYNAIFGLSKISEKLTQPPVEVNNMDWLMRVEGERTFTRQKAKVARIIASLEASPEKMAKVVKSVYGDDYPRIDAHRLAERLGLSSHLLTAIDNRPKSEDARQEVLTNLNKRLDTVRDDVLDDLYVIREEDARDSVRGPMMAAVHRRLFKMVSFFKGRAVTRKKMKAMVHQAIHFEPQDYETLARDFGVDVESARQLVAVLKNCFDKKGRFAKSAFADGLPHFVRYEKKIFEFLWRHLKDVIAPKDRTAFLNSLQALTARMKQPKRAFKILLEDFLKDPGQIQFSDAKALVLANLILHEYDKTLADFEITPEDILFDRRGLDPDVARYAAWRLDRQQDVFFEKMSTIHKALGETLELGLTRNQRIPVRDILGLEREVYIFVSMINTSAGCSVLRSAVTEYGNPESDLYFLQESPRFISQLLQNLRICIRGLATLGNKDDIPLLESVKAREEVFKRLKSAKAHREQSRLIPEWVDEAIKLIKFRG